jgi:acyl carrier protein
LPNKDPSLSQKVLEVTAEMMRERRLTATPDLNMPLGEDGLGFDSIGRLDLMGAIEMRCDLQIPEKYWGGRSLRDLNELIRVSIPRR